MSPESHPGNQSTHAPGAMSCEQFQAQMPELIGAGADLRTHPHVLGCALCRALWDDLEAIAEAARQLLPPVEPPDQLWEQIESAIWDNEPRNNEPRNNESRNNEPLK